MAATRKPAPRKGEGEQKGPAKGKRRAGKVGKGEKALPGASPSGPRRKSTLLEGRLTVDRAREIQRILSESLSAGGSCRLAFGDVSEVDLSFLQILVALGRSTRALGMGLAVEGGFPPLVEAALREAGLEGEAGFLKARRS